MYIYQFKAFLVAAMALFFTIVAFTNIMDYNTNWIFVKEVLSMKTTFSSSHLRGRAITNETVQHFSYIVIILMEILAAIYCWLGAYRLLKYKTKKTALFGLALGFLLYFVGFCVIASEWFAMWQGQSGAQHTAYLFSGILLLIMIFINQNEKI